MARSIIYSTPPFVSRSIDSPVYILDIVAAKDRMIAGAIALRYRKLYQYEDIYRAASLHSKTISTKRFHLGET